AIEDETVARQRAVSGGDHGAADEAAADGVRHEYAQPLRGRAGSPWDIGRARRARRARRSRRVEVVDERDGVKLVEELHGLARRVEDGRFAGLRQERLNLLSRDQVLDQGGRRGKLRGVVAECRDGVVGLYADRLTLIGERRR